MEDQIMENFLSNYNPNNSIIVHAEIACINKYKENISYLTVQSSSFTNSTFKNCDIVGCKFYNNKFSGVSLDNDDIISLQISNCQFENVSFNGTCIEDIDFKNCIFDNCSFNNFTMKNCCFSGCEFYKFKPSCCLCELNNYIECIFTNSAFSSSFHYQIFSGCVFNNTSIELELLGYNYGLLSNDQIAIKNNNSEKYYSTNRIDQLYRNYLEQNLYANAFILKINFEYDDNPSVLLLWADFLEIIIKNDIIIKSNEILFIKNLTSYFSRKKQIAPLLLFALNNKLIDTLHKLPIENSKIKDEIILLINNTYFEFKKIVQEFSNKIDDYPSENGKLLIEMKYLEKPEKDLSQILNQFGVGYCEQVKTESGSFYEWISCPDNMIKCLEIFLMLLGIAVPIVYDSIKTKKKTEKKQADVFDLSENTSTNITINVTINNGCQILNNCNFVENNFYGYNNKNVQKVKIFVEK